MFEDLGQFKAYLREIDSFDQLYIIQQGGRGVTREQIIRRLEERVIVQDAEAVFDANPHLWKNIGVTSWQDLQNKCSSKAISAGGLKVYFKNVIGLTH